MLENARNWLNSLGLSDRQSDLTLEAIALAGVAILAVLANWVAKKVILTVVRRVARHTKSKWDDVLIERKVFDRVSHLAPALVIWRLAPVSVTENYTLSNLIRQLAEVYMVLACLGVIYALMEAGREILRSRVPDMRAPIRVYIQVIKILVGMVAAVLIFSITLDKSPWLFLSGMGAMTAVLMLIFKDSILGLVAGIQLSTNDMVRHGDWISMPQFGADGDVMEVALTTVKVRNWDKTITTIPTYALISNSFKNWRGMETSGGRRIKRSVFIDVNSICFLTPEMAEKLARIKVLEDYIADKQRELAEYNEQHNIDDTSLVNGRRMTNVGTFRAYLVRYLRNHPKLHQDMTLLVRQLQPMEKGLPIEIYVFSRDQRWAAYEEIQADIFDHIFAALPEFGLRPYQMPAGTDLIGLRKTSAS